MDSLAVLARLARQALDEERQELLLTEQAMGATRKKLDELREATERERRAACGLTDGHARLVAYLRRLRGHTQGLQVELRRLEDQRQAQSARLAERHADLKRLEILAERRAERVRAERLRREQRAIDELVLLSPRGASRDRG